MSAQDELKKILGKKFEQEPEKDMSLEYAMETYGMGKREIDGIGEVFDSKFTDFGKVMTIREFRILDEGGCELYVNGDPIPLRLCINSRTNHVHAFKKVFTVMARSLKSPIGILYVIKNWRMWVEFAWHGMKETFYCDKKFYQQPVRALYDVIPNEQLRDIFCAVLEYDDAYRYRFQDVVGELNKENFENHPFKETMRLVKIYGSRQPGVEELKKKRIVTMKSLFTGICYAVFLYLFLHPKKMKQLKQAVKKLDIESIKMNKSDWHWSRWTGYNVGGFTLEERVNF